MAARAAGYAPTSARRQGWRLLRSPRIQARIREIQAELADHQCRADDAVIGKLEVVYRRALEAQQFYAAARAAELQGKLLHRRRAGTAAAADRPAGMDTLRTPMDPVSPKASPRCPSPDAPDPAALTPIRHRR